MSLLSPSLMANLPNHKIRTKKHMLKHGDTEGGGKRVWANGCLKAPLTPLSLIPSRHFLGRLLLEGFSGLFFKKIILE